MPTITISDEQRDQLAAAGQWVELVDAAGERVGRVVPYLRAGGHLFECPRPEQSGDEYGRTYTSDEVLGRLHKITEALS